MGTVREEGMGTNGSVLPATPYDGCGAYTRLAKIYRSQLRQFISAMDPPILLNHVQEELRAIRLQENVATADRSVEMSRLVARLVANLLTSGRDTSLRARHRKPARGPHGWRTRTDPFCVAWPQIEKWLSEEPEVTAKALFGRLQAVYPSQFSPGQLRTLQRRIRQWHLEAEQRDSRESEYRSGPNAIESRAAGAH
jgi:hypothetical protein